MHQPYSPPNKALMSAASARFLSTPWIGGLGQAKTLGAKTLPGSAQPHKSLLGFRALHTEADSGRCQQGPKGQARALQPTHSSS
jgi:hypothetical protein